MLKYLLLPLFLLLSVFQLFSQKIDSYYPKDGQYVSGNLQFNWNQVDTISEFELKVYGDSLATSSIGNYPVVGLEKKINLASGTYFWKLFGIYNGLTADSSSLKKLVVFNPKTLINLSLWLKADTGLTISSASISDWQDLSDSTVVVSQANVSKQPVLVSNVLNGYPVVDFDAINDALEVGLDLSGNSFLISALYNVHEISSKGIRLIDGQNNWLIGPHSGKHRGFNGAFYAGKDVVEDQFVTQSVFVKNDTTKNYVNNILYGQNEASYSPGATISIGDNKGINCSIAEIIILKGNVADSVRQNIDNYLMDKYAPPVNLGADRKVCSFPDSIALGIDYALNYSWSTGDTTDAIQIDSAGKYYVTITDMFERTSVDSIWFTLDTTNYQVDFEFEDSTICLGDSIRLTAGNERFSYQWNTSDTTNSISVKNQGRYKVTVKNCLGNFSNDSVQVTINNPRFDLGIDTTACFNQALQLSPDSIFTNVSYQWSNGATTTSILADTVRNYHLTVTDDFGCSFTDSINVAIDSSLFGSTLGPDTSLCEGNFIGLIEPDPSVVNYLWSTGNLNASQLIDTAGSYSVQVNSNRCSVSDTIQIAIQGLAPTAIFSASNFCFQDSVSFSDSSFAKPGASLISWSWDFDDGQLSSQINPSHYFNSVGDFRVALEVTTDKNCSDTISKIVTIQPKPQANFTIDNLINCSKEPIQFLDSSSISSGSILRYIWKFNDVTNPADTAIDVEPIYTFDTLGNYAIELIVVSNEGCKDTVSKTQFINPSPAVAFDFLGSCLNDSTYFIDKTILPQGTIESYLWAANGQISLDENAVFKFLSAGDKPIVYRVRTTAGCQNILRDTVRIFENPVAAFSSSLACIEDSFKLMNRSTSTDSIVQYSYSFGAISSSQQNPSFYGSQLGVYNAKLKVITENTCEDSILQQIQINPSPKAAFTILNNSTGVPFKIELTNNSLMASSYKWEFGNGDLSLEEVPNYTYRDSGRYDLKLIASSQKGCKDSLAKQVIALPYFLDALLERLILEENSNGELIVSAQILNVGNNSIASLKLSADLNNQYQIKETFNETIFSGNSLIVTFLGQFIVDKGQKVDFVCVKIEEVNGVDDEVLINNSACENGFNRDLVLNAYPNPTSETLILEYVLPQKGELKINVYDQLGRKVLDEISTQAEEGFYQSRLNVINLRPGIYYYNFSLNGEKLNGAFLKR